MNRSTRLAFLALSCVAALSLGASTASAAPSDAWLTTKVKMALLVAPEVPAMDVSVDTVRGTITLHGTVSTQAEKIRAEEIARSIEGARGVRSLLQVVSNPKAKVVAADDAAIERDVGKALAREPRLADSSITVRSVNKGVVLLGGEAQSLSDHLRALEAARSIPGVVAVATEVRSPERMADEELWRTAERNTTSGKRSVSAAVRDGWITTDIKMRLLADSDVPALDINVDTRNGEVKLFGTVPDKTARRAAERDARSVDGVRRVVNDLQVVAVKDQKAVRAADAEIKTEVERLLSANADLTATSIRVEVKKGVVRLTGNIAHESERLAAATDARSVIGVRAVIDDLRRTAVKAER